MVVAEYGIAVITGLCLQMYDINIKQEGHEALNRSLE